MQIINTDTTWGAGQVINLTEDVQIAPGATLTIAPGAQINGNTNGVEFHQIEVFGTLKAVGGIGSEILLSNVILNLSDNSKYNGNIILDHVQVNGAAISPPTGNGAYGTFSVTNSIISNAADNFGSNYWYAWYPLGSNKINGNIFVAEQPISLGIMSGSIDISNNVFDNYKGGAITNWAAYGAKPLLSNNAYLMPGEPTLALQYDNSAMISSGDYFGGASLSQLNAMIYDRNDDLSISGTIELQNVRSIPSATLPTDLFTFTSIDMPSDIVKTARIVGSANVSLNGNKLDNTITVGSGNDTINGKGGTDTAVFHGTAAQYSIAIQNGSVVVTDNIAGRDGTDTLISVELAKFTDGTVAADLPVTPDNSLIYRLYQAAFARMPDDGGLRYWVDQHNNGLAVSDMSGLFRASPEFAEKYGSNLTNAQYIDLLYMNVLGRKGEPGGVEYWNGVLDGNKANRDAVLLNFAASPENITGTAPHVDHGYFIV